MGFQYVSNGFESAGDEQCPLQANTVISALHMMWPAMYHFQQYALPKFSGHCVVPSRSIAHPLYACLINNFKLVIKLVISRSSNLLVESLKLPLQNFAQSVCFPVENPLL
eukprot:1140761-Pelagomonas_calceolata.AAC.4